MNNLKKQIQKIKKSYFTFADLRKISHLNDASLRVAISRLLKTNELNKLNKGYYCLNKNQVDYQKAALELYNPSYLSFEWALGQYNILSQKSYALSLATSKRTKHTKIGNVVVSYHHLRQDIFLGFIIKNGYLIAEAEKAFLDLAYLSLNGYAKFDPKEMNLALLNKKKLKNYLNLFKNKRLHKLINKELGIT